MSSTNPPTNEPASAQTVAKGDVVSIRYTGTLDDGEVFDSNMDDDAELLEFEAGAEQVIPGFDAAVLGMRVGETKKFRLEPADAYGEYDEELVQKVPREEFGELELEEGMHVDLEDEEGNLFHADVLEFDAESVTLDMNPHLAGEALTFNVTVVDVRKA